MSNFEVKVQPIFVKDHPNADKLQLGNIGSPDGWQVVIGKGLYQTGDLCAYIGENAVVPEWVLKEYGYWNEEKGKGMLAGSKGTRVKAIKLRDEFSLGICIPVQQSIHIDREPVESYTGGLWYKFRHSDPSNFTSFFQEGEDVSDLLEVIKYEAPIPTQLAGEVYNMGLDIGVNYDIENIKNFPDVFLENEEVQVTEKLHGSLCQVVVIPFVSDYYHLEHLPIEHSTDPDIRGYIAISSKGLGGKGLFLKHNENNAKNLYIRTTNQYFEKFVTICDDRYYDLMTVVGEVFGDGVQDLKYGLQNETQFRVFDVYIGPRGQGRWLNDTELDDWCDNVGVKRVPILYRGPFSKEKIRELTQHTKSTLAPLQVGEGGVIKPVIERYHEGLGRVCLKSVDEDYLCRKGNITEYN